MEIGKNIKVRDHPSPNNVTLMGNKTVFVLEDYYKTTKKNDYVGQANINDPTVVKKKHLNCICKLSTCKCSTIDDPEKWFVKTYLNKNSKIHSGKYYISNRTFHSPKINTLDYSDMINRNLGGVRKNWGNAFDYRFEENYKMTKNRYRFLPMSNYNKKKIINFEKNINFKCECLKCRFQPDKTKRDLILFCSQCGPIKSNSPNEYNNFTKILHKKNNKLKIITNFLQIT
ncbi:hypothetical protein Phum_PHUM411810 [Pediculus humanus corporis]|uniref:Uncharacterized protein n=1 Tax=Pediculus humanus subsp. corporis TaxID=121224 RepID=E0VS52_PEDHC|nr:uncharacterized protein Phum_PHUM411810 [Pediculus humanus corporis]EEB16208.1 hypothetical protein Phum_PHUM411810 [Pediculus humanus corporis]